MSFEKVREYLEQFGLGDRAIDLAQCSGTVAQAAADLGCEEAHIAKTMAFQTKTGPILVVLAGDAKINNSLYKARFGTKAVMIPPDKLVELVGHPMGGVCPFDHLPGVPVYLDESLRRFDIVYPAAGTDHSAVRLHIPELERAAQEFAGWVDVGKGWRPEES